ncbi:MAG: phosphate-binding protein, partial [Thiohalorhabdaceae bacterium]
IVQKVRQNREALGIFGYSFLEENDDRIQAATVDGVEPEPETISSGEYPVSRSLFFYVKNSHAGEVPGLYDYVELFMAEKMIGDLGFLKDRGLIPLPKDQREAMREAVNSRDKLTLSEVKEQNE